MSAVYSQPVGIATGYGLDGPAIEFRWGRDFPHLSRPALGPTQSPVQWVPDLSPRVKSGRGVTLTPQLLLVPWSWKSRAIPLLPLWAVRSLQSLSACTRVHFTFLPFIQPTHWTPDTVVITVCSLLALTFSNVAFRIQSLFLDFVWFAQQVAIIC